jgi:hypothetical protein
VRRAWYKSDGLCVSMSRLRIPESDAPALVVADRAPGASGVADRLREVSGAVRP